jgi:2-(1,2-epoxy-1,2-dihydrophenyl)acetyl-CoA isomerase
MKRDLHRFDDLFQDFGRISLRRMFGGEGVYAGEQIIGLVPDGGITWTLPYRIGLARAREMALLAEKLPAEKALEWGLINRVMDDARLQEEALALAKRLADGPAALPLARKLFWDRDGHEAQLAREAEAQQKAGMTGDFAEGLAAFQEKREPVFRQK